jgi:hypothetical protein
MKRIDAQFRPRRRPGRAAWAALATLAACAVLAAGAAAWKHQRVAVLRAQIAQLIEDQRNGVRPLAPFIAPAYDASARQFLRERAAGWAPMLRTLESGAMIGVTPSSVEFNAVDGWARVELNYSDSTALIDYLGRINEGVSPARDVARWSLVETRVLPSAGPSNGSFSSPVPQRGTGESVALIRSNWLDASPALQRGAGAP